LVLKQVFEDAIEIIPNRGRERYTRHD
jgi:hypothetical protein